MLRNIKIKQNGTNGVNGVHAQAVKQSEHEHVMSQLVYPQLVANALEKMNRFAVVKIVTDSYFMIHNLLLITYDS